MVVVGSTHPPGPAQCNRKCQPIDVCAQSEHVAFVCCCSGNKCDFDFEREIFRVHLFALNTLKTSARWYTVSSASDLYNMSQSLPMSSYCGWSPRLCVCVCFACVSDSVSIYDITMFYECVQRRADRLLTRPTMSRGLSATVRSCALAHACVRVHNKWSQ